MGSNPTAGTSGKNGYWFGVDVDVAAAKGIITRHGDELSPQSIATVVANC